MGAATDSICGNLHPSAVKGSFIRVHSCAFAVELFISDSLMVSFPDTELAEDPAEEIFGVMPANHVTDGIECTSELDRYELW